MRTCIAFLLLMTLAGGAPAQSLGSPGSPGSPGTPGSPAAGASFDGASADAQRRLDEAIAELAELRRQIEAETVPMSRQLGELEAKLANARQELQQLVRTRDSRKLDVSIARNEAKGLEEQIAYLTNLLEQYVRSFDSRLHIAEVQRYREPLEAARLAPENTTLSPSQVLAVQADLLSVSLDRLFESLGGSRFEGTAVDASGTVQRGTFVLLGPSAVFRSADGSVVGTAELRLGSQEPSIVAFADPEAAAAAATVALSGQGTFPLDPTLGNAHKMAATRETLVEHVVRGGPVMVPIFALAALALLIALYKALAFLFVGRPSRRRMRTLLEAISRNDRPAALKAAKATGRPANRMLVAGVEHMDEPRELVEEVMFETVLHTRLKLQRFLPFIAICAAAAPLLGLLGTVMGIIDTFKSITVFGSGDVKHLSGGISRALITTEFGLIVAIPSLLLHAILARRAKAIVDAMEVSGAAFLNELSRAKWRRGGGDERPVAVLEEKAAVPEPAASPAAGREPKSPEAKDHAVGLSKPIPAPTPAPARPAKELSPATT